MSFKKRLALTPGLYLLKLAIRLEERHICNLRATYGSLFVINSESFRFVLFPVFNVRKVTLRPG